MMMPIKRETQIYEFGPFRLDSAERLLMRDSEVVPLPPKVLDTLLVLVEHSGHVLEKDDLIKTLWPDTFVEEGSLTRNISYLRKTLGEGDAARAYIETIPRRGYRFVAPVKTLGNGQHESAAEQPVEAAALEQGSIGETARFSSAGNPQTAHHNLVNSVELRNGLTHHEGFIKDASPGSIPDAVSAWPQWARRWGAVITIIAVALLMAAWGLYQIIDRSRSASGWASAASKLRVDKLTQTGQARLPAFSADGRMVAYVQDDGKSSSVWLRQTASGTQVQIVPPADALYQGLTFSRDGNYLYYVTYEKGQTVGALYQVPLLGGVARRLINDVDSPVTFSPDGRQLAFLRNYPERGETTLLITDAESHHEKTLAKRARPSQFILTGLAWSPDGQTIACTARHEEGKDSFAEIVLVNVKDGSTKPLTFQQDSERWLNIGQMAWLRDGSGLLAVAWRQRTPTFADQVWYFPYPNGEPQRVTSDANTYAGLGLMANGRVLVTSQFMRETSIEVAPTADFSRVKQVASGLVGNANMMLGVDWTPDGRIVYSSDASGHSDIWIMNADGSNKRQLTDDGPTDLAPAVSADGRAVAFVSYRSGVSNIWRMDMDGRNLRPLADTSRVNTPSFSPDGQWVVYEFYGENKSVICKVAAAGGAPVQLTDFYSFRPVVSPDGKWLAFFLYDDQAQASKIGVIPFGNESSSPVGRAAVKTFGNLPRLRPPILQWAGDSRSLIYNLHQGGVSNLWRQPLEGGSPTQITAFTAGRLFSFALSRDGNQLVSERGKIVSDIVLISDFK